MRTFNRHRCKRHGSILLAVLVLIAAMTIGGLAYFNWTNIERRASSAFLRQTQARAAAESGGEYLRALLQDDLSLLDQDGGVFDNPNRFRGLLLRDSDAAPLRSRVSLVAPAQNLGVYEGYRFGLEDESSRINLNTILLADDYQEEGARNLLLGLPGMTESIADAILDWLDEDDEPRPFGAERAYYSSLTPAYAPANGPLDAIDQLLLVRDVTKELLYGLDRNQNYSLDGGEALRGLPAGVDNFDGAANRGLAAYLTLSSAEPNIDANGAPKIDVNQDDLEKLHSEIDRALGREAANFIVAFRQGGPEQEGGQGNEQPGFEGGAPGGNQTVTASQVRIDFGVPGSEQISNLLSLVGVNTSTTQAGDDQAVTVETPFPDSPGELRTFLPDLMDRLTVTSDAVIPGRVNINQAPRAVLVGLPGMPPEAVDLIISSRDEDNADAQPGRRHGGWLLAEGLIDLEAMRQLEPFVTGAGGVFRAQCVGFFDAEGPTARVEMVVDATGQSPEFRYRRELTPLGAGFTAEELGATPDAPLAGQVGQGQ